MPTLALIWGILAMVATLLFFLPCLGALNWLNVPFAGVGVVLSVIAVAQSKGAGRAQAVAALVLNMIAGFFGTIRLMLGGGIL